MELPSWETCSSELAKHLVGETSRTLENHQPDNSLKTKAPRPLSGLAWERKTMRGAGAAKLSPIVQWAIRNPATKTLASALKTRLYKLWPAPPELRATDPRKRWNLIATPGLNDRASDEVWDKLI